jgi:WD40 repeat protein
VSQDLLNSRGVSHGLEAYVVGAAWNRSGTRVGFGLGDGCIVVGASVGEWPRFETHDGGVLAIAADLAEGFISGGDDGALCRTGLDGTVSAIARFGSKWVEQVASFRDGATSLIACAVGKNLYVLNAAGERLKELPHPSTVTGIAFDAKGKRVAASHYGGASLWFVGAKADNPRKLEWKGSHTGVTIHPAGDAVVTSMQENALHGWRLADGQHMRMSGYPGRTGSLSWSRHGKWLASSGADAIVMWPFTGGGPMGKAPLELAQITDIICTQVAFHPQHDIVAAGYADGTVVMADIGGERVLQVKAPGDGEVSALCWNPQGTLLAFGTSEGLAGVVDLAAR